MKKLILSLALLSAFASTTSQAADVYAGVNFPSMFTIGYTHDINSSWGLRADYSGGANYSADGNRDGVNATANFTSSVAGAYADWHPFEGGFRVVGGVTFNDTRLNVNAVGSGNSTINGNTVNMTGEYYNVNVRMPSTTPYFGLGWGHQAQTKGLGFYFDIGAMIGDFQVDSNTSLVTSGKATQADINAQNQKIRDGVNKLGFMPVVSTGITYRF